MTEQVFPGQLISEVAAQPALQGVDEAKVKAHARMVLSLIREGLLADGQVRVHNFGTFRLKHSKPRRGTHPQTGEAMDIPARPRVLFTPAKALREAVEPQPQKPVTLAAPTAPTAESKPAAAATEPEVVESEARKTESMGTVEPKPPTTSTPESKPAPVSAPAPTEANEPAAAEVALPEALREEAQGEASSEPRWGRVALAAALVLTVGTYLLLRGDDPAQAPQPMAEAPAPDTSPQAPESSPPTEMLSAREAPAPGPEPESTEMAALAPDAPPEPLSEVGTPPQETGLTQEEMVAPSPVEPELAVIEPFFEARDYTLASGNSLWRLADRHYLNPVYWPHIYYANAEDIGDPDLIQIDQVITLPTLYGEPDALWPEDKRSIAEGYFLVYRQMVEEQHPEAPYALLAVAHFDRQVVEEHRDEIRQYHPYVLRITQILKLESSQEVASTSASGIPRFR